MNMKYRLNITMDVEVVELAKEERINISDFCNKALKEYFKGKKETRIPALELEEKTAEAKLQAIKAQIRKIKEVEEKEKIKRRKNNVYTMEEIKKR